MVLRHVQNIARKARKNTNVDADRAKTHLCPRQWLTVRIGNNTYSWEGLHGVIFVRGRRLEARADENLHNDNGNHDCRSFPISPLNCIDYQSTRPLQAFVQHSTLRGQYQNTARFAAAISGE